MPKQWITERDEMETILRECEAGSLATVCSDGAPYVVPLNYVYHDGRIYFHGALKGKKLDNIANEPRVCFEVHILERIVRSPRSAAFGVRYCSVIIHGQARQVTDPEAKMDALMALTAKYANGDPFDPPTEQDIAITAVVEIEIEGMTGKRNTDPQ